METNLVLQVSALDVCPACTGSAVPQRLCRNDVAQWNEARKTSPAGAKDLSPALQRWVEWEIRPSPVRTEEVATQSLQTRL